MGNIIKPEVVNQLSESISQQRSTSNRNSDTQPNPPPTTFADIRVYQITKPFYRIHKIDCDEYSIHTKCPVKDENCEVCKNFAYRDWYEEYNAKKIPILGIFEDSKAEYNRTWVQTCNLGIGIVLLSIGIYYQQSQ